MKKASNILVFFVVFIISSRQNNMLIEILKLKLCLVSENPMYNWKKLSLYTHFFVSENCLVSLYYVTCLLEIFTCYWNVFTSHRFAQIYLNKSILIWTDSLLFCCVIILVLTQHFFLGLQIKKSGTCVQCIHFQ